MKTVNFRNVRTTKTITNPIAAAQIVNKYRNGVSLARLSIAFDFGTVAIRTLLTTNNIVVRPRGRYTAAMTA